jgi:hypothetical protein
MNERFVTVAERFLERYATGRPLRVAAVLAVLVCAILVGAAIGLGGFFLTMAGGMLLLVITLLWNSLQSLTDENSMSLQEALALGGPSPQEEQKRAVLRALKDLEYERSVGKISEEDYAELAQRFRQQAKDLLRALDQNLAPYRERVEAELQQRLAAEGAARRAAKGKGKRKRAAAETERARAALPAEVAEPASAETHSAPEHDAELAEAIEPTLTAAAAPTQRAAVKRPTRRCKDCETRNDLDAHYCKRCGQALSKPGQVLCMTCPAVYSGDLAECPECGMPAENA